MTRYEAIEAMLREARKQFGYAPHSLGYEYTILRQIDAALALPEDGKVVNAELYGLAVSLSDEYVREEVELTCAVAKCMGDNSEFDTKAHAKELRYLELRESSGDPMPYKVIREGDKVRFE